MTMELSDKRETSTVTMVNDEGVGCVDDSCYTDDREIEDIRKHSLHVEASSNSTVDELENNTLNGTFLDGTMMIGGDPTTILSSKGRENGSVISAMTDLNSLEGPNVPSLLGEEETASQRSDPDMAESGGKENDAENDNDNNDSGIPKQVILPQDDTALNFSGHNDDDVDHNVNYLSPTAPSDTCSSPLSHPTGKSLQQHPTQHPTDTTIDMKKIRSRHLREFSDQSVNDATATTAPSTLMPQQMKDVTSAYVTDDKGAQLADDDIIEDDKYDDNNVALDDYIRSPEVQNAIVERSPGGRYVRFMEKLGSGASKDVYRAYDTQEGIEVAWNVVNLSGVPKAERNRIVNEVRLLERLHHQNIISFHGSWVNRERQEVNFVTEILSSGTLKSFINKVQVIRWKIAKRWAFQILKGLEYLHSQDPPVIHRDLKCENIFINGTSGDLRIGDLGLSTVHRNGKVLSVLGTPEFMAPDMYEENSYNEKVDVYAFGMCLLEIFTKEIPYSECSNPAQIYRKVVASEPPEVLSRLQSRHAREFVLLCLGYRDEKGNFIRPTVSELLQHPFLEKRANDDDEVVVDLPPRHAPQDSISEPVANGTPTIKRRVSTHSSQTLHHHNNSTSGELTHSRESSLHSEGIPVVINDTTPKHTRNNSMKQVVASPPDEDEEDGDRFEEMQESEITMRKVKVLMGRGQELKEDDELPSAGVAPDASRPQQETNGNGSDVVVSSDADQTSQAYNASTQLDEQNGSGNGNIQEAPVSFQYLVDAAVVENENPNVRPYIDDILKLVVTLPVDGQTQNVQFDFHLVEDDPVQVAKEMVKELGIPQGAVLEISETISGLARSARMKQDRHAARIQSLPAGTVSAAVQQAPRVVPDTQVQQQSYQQNMQPEIVQYNNDQQQLLPYSHVAQPVHHIQQQLVTQSTTTISSPQHEVHHYQDIQQKVIQQAQHTTAPSVALHSDHACVHPHQGHVQVAEVSSRVHSQDIYSQQQAIQPATNQAQQHSLVQGAQIVVDGNTRHAYLQTNGTPVPLSQHSVPPSANDQQFFPNQTNVQQVQNHLGPVSFNIPEPIYYQNQPDSNQIRAPDQTNYNHREMIHGHPLHAPLPGTENELAHSMPQPVQSNMSADVTPSIGRPPIQVRQRSGDSDKSSDSRENAIEYSHVQVHQTTFDASQNNTQIQATNHHAQSQLIVTESQLTQTANIISGAQSVATPHVQHTSNQSQQRLYAEAELISLVPNRNDISVEQIQGSHLQRRTSSEVSPMVDGQAAQIFESEGDSDEEDDVDVADELRKLDEDFQKNLERANKVFVNRMDNLQRSQIEREAQHLKTLEKHEKDKAEFEKRLAQEADQQQRRVEQLQREWDKKRETVAIQKKKQKDTTLSSTTGSDPNSEISHGHLRTVSATSSNFSLSPAMSLHKQLESNSDPASQIDR